MDYLHNMHWDPCMRRDVALWLFSLDLSTQFYVQTNSCKQKKTVMLMTIFLVAVIGLGWFFGAYLGYGYEIFILAIVISIGMSTVSYFNGDKVALKSAGAKEVSKQDNPYVHRMVENLCITAGMPLPKVHIIDSPALNAFATGRDPEHASIAITTGLINALENEELEGVIAHELSHIQNYDIRVMTIVVVLVGTIALLSDLLIRARLYGGKGKSSKVHPAILIVGLVLLILSPIIAETIKFAISRKREYLADASGSLLTRYPEGLARALEKIQHSNVPLQTASSATAHLFISNPFKKGFAKSFFSTHPPIEERISRLRNM